MLDKISNVCKKLIPIFTCLILFIVFIHLMNTMTQGRYAKWSLIKIDNDIPSHINITQ